MEKIKVLIVDDHATLRRGVAEVLAEREELKVVGQAGNGLEGIELAKALSPEVILMDLTMPVCGGLEATQRLQMEYPQGNILIFTVSEKEEDLHGAIKAGARGYLLKDASPEDLVQAVLYIAKGGVIISPAMASKLLADFQVPTAEQQDTSGLSQREQGILGKVSQGATNKEIAAALFISENTVKTHLRNIMDKLHLANRSQVAAYAARKGLGQRQGR